MNAFECAIAIYHPTHRDFFYERVVVVLVYSLAKLNIRIQNDSVMLYFVVRMTTTTTTTAAVAKEY